MPWMHELRSENLAVCLQWETGMGVLLPSRLGDLGDRRKLPSGVRGRAPAKKQVLEYLELEKNTPDFTSRLFPDFFHFPWTLEFPDFSRFSRWVVTLKHAGYVVEGISLPNWLCTLCWLCWCAHTSPDGVKWGNIFISKTLTPLDWLSFRLTVAVCHLTCNLLHFLPSHLRQCHWVVQTGMHDYFQSIVKQVVCCILILQFWSYLG